MKPENRRYLRQILGILILIISLILLIWGFWPFPAITQSIQLAPVDMQLPSPDSILPLTTWIA